MSWRLAFHSTKLLFSYLFPYKVRVFRDAIFDGDLAAIRQLATERPRLLQQSIDADGNTALGIDSYIFFSFNYYLNIRFGIALGRS
jgi:hypothetical protein